LRLILMPSIDYPFSSPRPERRGGSHSTKLNVNGQHGGRFSAAALLRRLALLRPVFIFYHPVVGCSHPEVEPAFRFFIIVQEKQICRSYGRKKKPTGEVGFFTVPLQSWWLWTGKDSLYLT
ncbi:TPA: hypothetical protein ACWP16_004143, partial [Escherichia coli]